MATFHTGSWGTPDLGITEAVQRIVSPFRNYTSQNGSNLIGKNTSSQGGSVLGIRTNSAPIVAPSPSSKNQIPGLDKKLQPIAKIQNPGTGGSVLGDYNGVPFEEPVAQDSMNWDEIYAPAFEGLNAQESALQPQYEADVAQATNAAQTNKEGALQDQQAKLAEYQGQRDTETGRTNSVISEARRQASELLQGIQARYGGTTHLGEAASSILGGQATQNIAQNRAALQTALSGITQSENALKQKTTDYLGQIDRWLDEKKTEARAKLEGLRADISAKRGQLQSEKAKEMIGALRDYQSYLQDLNTRNTQLKQSIYNQALEHQQKLDDMRKTAAQKYEAGLKPSEFSQITGLMGVDNSPEQQALAQSYLEQYGYSLPKKKAQDKYTIPELPGTNSSTFDVNSLGL